MDRQAQAIEYGIWNVSRYGKPAKPTPIVDAIMLALGWCLLGYKLYLITTLFH